MFQTIISTISSFMYSKLLVILLIGAGVYFTVRTRFPQVRLFKNACGSVMEKPEDKGAISSFQALMVSTASRVGTGNIVGVSSAICIGGFGSVFWMWVIAIIGSASALIESTLAQIYKKKGEDGFPLLSVNALWYNVSGFIHPEGASHEQDQGTHSRQQSPLQAGLGAELYL